MATQVWFEPWHDDDVERTCGDRALAPRTDVVLARLVGLDGVDEHVVAHPKNPQATRAAVMAMNTTTSSTSAVVRFCSRNGLNPMCGNGRTSSARPGSVGRRAVCCAASPGGALTTAGLFSIDDHALVRYLTLRRPETRNAIPAEGWAALADAFAGFEDSPQRVLILSGEGGDFSSGADLSTGETRFESTVGNHRRMRVVGDMALRLHRCSKPTIAVVDGVAVGAGMNLALACDIVIATERARFAELFVRRGLVMDAGGTWLLPRLVGHQRALDLALTGRIVEADEAAAIGLVTRLVDSTVVDDTVAEYVELLLAGAPLAQRFLKVGLGRSSSMTFEQSLAWESQAQSILLATDDFAEAVAAFGEQRAPRFEGS